MSVFWHVCEIKRKIYLLCEFRLPLSPIKQLYAKYDLREVGGGFGAVIGLRGHGYWEIFLFGSMRW